MSEKWKESFVSEIRIPKLLLEQAADAFTFNLLLISLPIIETLSYTKTEETASENGVETPNAGNEPELKNNPKLETLKSLKSWYWNDLAELLGECDSKLRCIISKSVLAVSSLYPNFWHCEPLHRFTFQLLFACDAGNSEGLAPCFIETPVCRQFSRFLLFTSPFYIRGLYDNSVQFSEPLPFNLVMVNSSDLKRIQLFQNISSSSLDSLRISCTKAETITLDLENDPSQTSLVEDNLFRAFFENKGRDFVLEHMRYEIAVPQSFPNLKEVFIRCDHIIISLALFIQSLHYTYSNINITVSCMASVPYGRFVIKYPFVCPTYQVANRDDGMKSARVYFCNDDIQIDEMTEPSSEYIVDADLLLHTYRDFVTDTYYMQDIMSMIQVCSLRYIFHTDMKINVSPCVPISADKIHDLFIFGPIPDETTDESLVESLNRCQDLRVLCFMIKPMIKPVLEGLNPFTNLKALSLYFTALKPCNAVAGSRFPHCQGGPLNEDEVAMFMELLIMAAPNLEVLEAPCLDILIVLTGIGHLQKIHTFSVIAGNRDNIKRCIMNLPHLKVLLLEKVIEYRVYFELKWDFYHSKLQVSYKNGRHVFPFII